ncbi:MAG: MipA/OmpV family protein [Acidovorax sp.]|nr:MipA/OmpV family protein [Acidovorax sp.]
MPDRNGGTVGLAVVAGHEYMGSDERRTRAYPAIDYRWANGWFAGTTNGIGYNFSRQPGVQYGTAHDSRLSGVTRPARRCCAAWAMWMRARNWGRSTTCSPRRTPL